MGYYGDFDVSNIIDKPASQTEVPTSQDYDGSIFANVALYDMNVNLLGAKYCDKDFILTASGGSSTWLNLQKVQDPNVAMHSTDNIVGETNYGSAVPVIELVRDAYVIKPRLVDASGKVYKEFISVYNANKGQEYIFSEWAVDGKWINPETGRNEQLPDGQYYYEILTSTLHDPNTFQSLKLPLKIDNQPPTASNLVVTVDTSGNPDIDTNFNDGTLVDDNPAVHITGTMIDLESGIDTSNHYGVLRINDSNDRPDHLEDEYKFSGQTNYNFDFKLDKWQKSSLVNGINEFWLYVYDYAGNMSQYNFTYTLGDPTKQGSPLFGSFSLTHPADPPALYNNPRDSTLSYNHPEVEIIGRSTNPFYVYVTKWDQDAFEADVMSGFSADKWYATADDIDWHQQLDRVQMVTPTSNYAFDTNISTPSSAGSLVYCSVAPAITDPSNPDYKTQTCPTANVLNSSSYYKINPLQLDIAGFKAHFSDPKTNIQNETSLSMEYIDWSELPTVSGKKILTVNAHLEATEMPIIGVCFQYKASDRQMNQNVCKSATNAGGDFSLDIDMSPNDEILHEATLAALEPYTYSFDLRAYPLIDSTRSIIRYADTLSNTLTTSPWADVQFYSAAVGSDNVASGSTQGDSGGFPTPYPAIKPTEENAETWNFVTDYWRSYLRWTNVIGQTDSNYFPQDGQWHKGYWWDTTNTGIRQQSDTLTFLSPIGDKFVPSWRNVPADPPVNLADPHAIASASDFYSTIYLNNVYYSDTFSLSTATGYEPTIPDWRAITTGTNSENGTCSDTTYTNKQDCILAHETWTPSSHCSISNIDTQVNCEAAGGKWTNDEEEDAILGYDLDGDGYISLDETNDYYYTSPDVIQPDAVLIAGKNSIQSFLVNNFGLKKFNWNPKTHEVTFPIQAGPAVCKLTLNTTGIRDPLPGTPGSDIVLIDRTSVSNQSTKHPDLHDSGLDDDACVGADTPNDPGDDLRADDAQIRPTGVSLSSVTINTELLDMQNWYLDVVLDQGPTWQQTCEYFAENPDYVHLDANDKIVHDDCPFKSRYYEPAEPYSATFVSLGVPPEVTTPGLDESNQINADATRFDISTKLSEYSDVSSLSLNSSSLATFANKEPFLDPNQLGKSLSPLATDPIEGGGTNDGDSTLYGFLAQSVPTSPDEGAKWMNDKPYKEYEVTTTDSTFDLSGISNHPTRNHIVYVNTVPTNSDYAIRRNGYDSATIFKQQFAPNGYNSPYALSLPLQVPTDANPQTINKFLIEYSDEFLNEYQIHLTVIRQDPNYDPNCPSGNCSGNSGELGNTGVPVGEVLMLLLMALLLGLSVRRFHTSSS